MTVGSGKCSRQPFSQTGLPTDKTHCFVLVVVPMHVQTLTIYSDVKGRFPSKPARLLAVSVRYSILLALAMHACTVCVRPKVPHMQCTYISTIGRHQLSLSLEIEAGILEVAILSHLCKSVFRILASAYDIYGYQDYLCTPIPVEENIPIIGHTLKDRSPISSLLSAFSIILPRMLTMATHYLSFLFLST